MIAQNLLRVKEKIASVCKRINADPDKIILVAVSKGRWQEEIKEAVNAGITDIGENRVQEAAIKYNAITSKQVNEQRIKWHLVGHLQTNKVKEAIKIFDLIHSVDSLRLAKELESQAAKINKVQDILLEVNISGETTKFGIKPEEAIDLIKSISHFKNIRILGLMTVAPLVDNPQKVRPYFRELRELRDKIIQLPITNYQLPILSMGMTDDFEVALEEGSNMIRLGRALFS